MSSVYFKNYALTLLGIYLIFDSNMASVGPGKYIPSSGMIPLTRIQDPTTRAEIEKLQDFNDTEELEKRLRNRLSLPRALVGPRLMCVYM